MSRSVSGGSSISQPARGRVLGVPKFCWCGEPVSTLVSKSDHNPYCRFFRCSYVVSEKAWDEDHIFKWVDEGLVEEVEMLRENNRELEEAVKFLRREQLKDQKRVEAEIKQRFEGMISEVKDSVKKTMVQVVIGCVVFGVFIKLVG